MEKNSGNFSIEQMKHLAQTDAAKQLMAMLEQSSSGAAQTIRNSAKNGDMEQAKKALSAFLADPKAQALLRQLEEQQHG